MKIVVLVFMLALTVDPVTVSYRPPREELHRMFYEAYNNSSGLPFIWAQDVEFSRYYQGWVNRDYKYQCYKNPSDQRNCTE